MNPVVIGVIVLMVGGLVLAFTGFINSLKGGGAGTIAVGILMLAIGGLITVYFLLDKLFR